MKENVTTKLSSLKSCSLPYLIPHWADAVTSGVLILFPCLYPKGYKPYEDKESTGLWQPPNFYSHSVSWPMLQESQGKFYAQHQWFPVVPPHISHVAASTSLPTKGNCDCIYIHLSPFYPKPWAPQSLFLSRGCFFLQNPGWMLSMEKGHFAPVSTVSRTIYLKQHLGFSWKPISMKFRLIDYLIIIIVHERVFSLFNVETW